MIRQTHEQLINKEISSKELTQKFFDTIKEKDKDIHAYLSLDEDGAMRVAVRADEKIASGEKLGMLEGVPLAVKDNMLVEGLSCTAASKMLEDYRAPYDATVVSRLKDAGAVILGKTNLDEFAMGASTENSAYGATRNPHDVGRVPGGSSGGSAAAVAADMCMAALGSDTGGSIRQPAAFCGIVGFKPTYGAVSRSGLISMASSLDQIGSLGSTVDDARIVFDTIRGKDEFDATSFDLKVPSSKFQASGLKVGVPKEYFGEGIDPRVKESVESAIREYEKNGAQVTEISLAHTDYGLPVYYIIMPSEVSSNLARYDGIRYGLSSRGGDLLEGYLKTRQEGFGKEVRTRIMLGIYTLSSGYYDAYYLRAQKVRTLIRQEFEKAFGEVDVIMTPATPTLPFRFGEKTKDPVSMYLSDVFTVGANLAGLPAVVIPCGWHDEGGKKLPVGLQLIGPQKDDYKVLDIAEMYEGFNK